MIISPLLTSTLKDSIPLIANPHFIIFILASALGALLTYIYFIESEKINKPLRVFTLSAVCLTTFLTFTDWIFGGYLFVSQVNGVWFLLVFFGMVLGHLVGFFIYYFGFLFYVWLKALFKRDSSAQRSTTSDIRTVGKLLPKPSIKSPQKYFKKGKCFVGFDRYQKPIYVSREKYVCSHKQLIGTTGCGKGKLLQSFIFQDCINQDIPVIFNPKSDIKQRQLVTKIAHELNRNVVFLELLGSLPQLDIFRNKSVIQIIELLEVFCGLTDKGTDADYYRLHGRASCHLFAKFVHRKKERFTELVNCFLVEYEAELKDSPKFVADLIELSSMTCIDAGESGFSIEGLLASNSVIFIEGSMRHSVAVKTQKLLLLSVMQACETRAAHAENFVGIYLDEFKYLISRPALEALGAIRDKKAHVTVAHQSLGDLRDCGADLDPDSVVASINENCALKWAFKVHDPDTADWLARMTGTILVDEELRKFTTNNAMIEVDEHERSLKQTARPLFDSNMFLSLPLGGAVIIGDGLAKFASISPIKLDENLDVIKPTVTPQNSFMGNNVTLSGLIDVD